MRRDDAIRLRHMAQAAEEALSYAEGCTRSDLESDTMRSRAIVRCIEIVGEAAVQMSPLGRDEIPAVPWAAIVAMRNRLVHAYFDIDLDRVWDTLTADLPELLEMLKPHLSREPGDGD